MAFSPTSADVVPGQLGTATQFNNLRTDALEITGDVHEQYTRLFKNGVNPYAISVNSGSNYVLKTALSSGALDGSLIATTSPGGTQRWPMFTWQNEFFDGDTIPANIRVRVTVFQEDPDYTYYVNIGRYTPTSVGTGTPTNIFSDTTITGTTDVRTLYDSGNKSLAAVTVGQIVTVEMGIFSIGTITAPDIATLEQFYISFS